MRSARGLSLGFLELVCPFFPRHRNAEAPAPSVVHVMKLMVGGRPNSMLVLSVVTLLAKTGSGPQTTSICSIRHCFHLPHLKLLDEAPKARRAAAMGAASRARLIMCIVQSCEPERKNEK